MTQATQTTLGEIKLAGDLSGTAEAPALSNTGVTAGTYVFPTLTVNSKGRITSATSGSSEDIRALIPGATKNKKGIVQVGDNIEVSTTTTQGYTLIDFGGTVVGTNDSGLEYDPCRPYTFKLNYTNGTATTNKTISYSPGAGGVTFNGLISALNTLIGYSAVSIVAGNIRFVPNSTGAGSFINLIDDCLFKYLTGYVGNISTDFGMDSSTIWVKEATVADYGVIKAGSGLAVANGVLSFDHNQIQKATPSTLGVVKVGSGLSVNSGVVSANPASFNLPIATDTTLGVVSVGDGIAVAGDGKISVTLPEATTTTKGVVQVGDGLAVSSGVVSVPTASYSTPGILSASASHFTLNDGELTVNLATLGATETTPGLVKIGTGLLASGGVISVDTNNLPAASKSAKGAVQVGANIDVVDGVISVPVASTTTKGVVKIDTSKGFIIDGSGRLSMTNATILASTTNAGLVRIGSNIGVTNNGIISVDVPDATASSKGKVQVGSGINVTSGTISIPTATTTTKGIVKVGDGLAVTDGVLSTSLAVAQSSGVPGVVKIGDNLTVDSNGVLSVPIATANTPGVVKIGTGLAINSNGLLQSDISILPRASGTTAGIVKIGEGLNVTADGLLTVAKATTSTLGAVKAGTGINLSNGVISVSLANATTSTAGIASVGSGLSVTNGVISLTVGDATESQKGIVKIGTGLTVTDGVVSVDSNNVLAGLNNVFRNTQIGQISQVSIGTSAYTPDLLDSNFINITGGQTFDGTYYMGQVLSSFNNPSIMSTVIGGNSVPITGHWQVAISFRLGFGITSWGNKYKFVGGTAPDFTLQNASYSHPDNTHIKMLSFKILDEDTILVFDNGTFPLQ